MMMARVYMMGNEKVKKDFESHYRKTARKVMVIPAGSLNEVVESIVGELKAMMESQTKAADYKLAAVRAQIPIDHCYLAMVKGVGRVRRRTPNKLRTLLRACYGGGTCAEHGKLMTQSHCGHHGITVDIRAILMVFDEGEEEDRRGVKKKLTKTIKRVNMVKN